MVAQSGRAARTCAGFVSRLTAADHPGRGCLAGHRTGAAGCSERAVLDGLLQSVTVDLRRAPTRARVDLRSLSRDVAAALKLFVDRRLLTSLRDADGVERVMLAHEMFFTEWAPS